MAGEIVTLPTQVIPPENTPEKLRTQTLSARPRWKYIGPGETIRFEWQIGRWGWAGFAGETARKYATRSQPASMELKEFTTSLPAISLSPLSPGDYDCEIWFKDKFPDLRVIVQNCVRIVEEAPPPPEPGITDLVIVSPTKSTWIGASIYITVMFKYLGPATSGQLYAAIGIKDTWFNEKWDSGWKTVSISAAGFPQTRLASVSIPIVGGSPGKYDIYAKIRAPGISDVFSPIYLDTITITL